MAGIVCEDLPSASLLLLIPPEEPAGTRYQLQQCLSQEPDHVADLGVQLGIGGDLKVCRFQGFRSLSRQIRATEANEIPISLASSRADPYVTPRCAGGAARVATTTARSSIPRGRPERSRSPNPAIPAWTYRFHHRITVGRDTPTIAAA